FTDFRGESYDTVISSLSLLPKDDLHVLFIMRPLGLSNLIGQGQTRYQHLVMQFSREGRTLTSADEFSKYDRLQKCYEAPAFEVVSSEDHEPRANYCRPADSPNHLVSAICNFMTTVGFRAIGHRRGGVPPPTCTTHGKFVRHSFSCRCVLDNVAPTRLSPSKTPRE
ncbi:hypothetical protein FA95DRAFT_1492589, partial [Auriscalpium vulgare]